MKLFKNQSLLLMTILCVFALSGCNGNASSAPTNTPNGTEETSLESENFSQSTEQGSSTEKEEADEMMAVSITVDGKGFSAKFHNNASAKAIASQMPFTLNMSDFSGQEKVAPLTFDLPSANTQTPSSINEGEIYLWSGNQLVFFYTTFSNSYSYVPIGYIEDVAGLTEALGSGSATITFRTE